MFNGGGYSHHLDKLRHVPKILYCCLNICPRAENGFIKQIGQWQIVVISHQYLPIEGFNSYCEAKKHILPHLYP